MFKRALPALFAVMMIVAGCTNSDAKKKEFLEAGKRLAAEKRYVEAILQFSNALQIEVMGIRGLLPVRLIVKHLLPGSQVWRFQFLAHGSDPRPCSSVEGASRTEFQSIPSRHGARNQYPVISR